MKVKANGPLRLDLSDFSPSWTVVDLHDKFSIFGPLTAFKIVEPGKSAFVEFKDATSARTAFVAKQKVEAVPQIKLTVQVGSQGQREVKSEPGAGAAAPLVFRAENRDTVPPVVDFRRPPPNFCPPPPPPAQVSFKFSTDEIIRRIDISNSEDLHPVKVTSVVSLPQFWVVKTAALAVREALRSYAAGAKTQSWDWSRYPAPGDTFLLENERVRVDELVGPDVKLFYLDKGASVTHRPFPPLREVPPALRSIPSLAVAVKLDATAMPSIDTFKREIQTDKLQLKVVRSADDCKYARLFVDKKELLFRDTQTEAATQRNPGPVFKKENLPPERNPAKNESKSSKGGAIPRTSRRKDKEDSSYETTSDNNRELKNKSQARASLSLRPVNGPRLKSTIRDKPWNLSNCSV